MGIGMGLSFIALQWLFRILFFKQNIRNHKNLSIQKLIYPEKSEITKKIKLLQVKINKSKYFGNRECKKKSKLGKWTQLKKN